VCPEVASSRFSALNPAARPPSLFISSPRAQNAGGLAAFIDAEHALDPTYAEAIGVDLENLYFSQPDNGEQALEIADTLVRSGAFDLVVIDSVAALVPRAEIEGEMGRLARGLQGSTDEPGLEEAARVS
jgi:protein RecA